MGIIKADTPRRLSVRPFMWGALLFLSFANVTFLCGWFHPVIANCISVLILAIVFFIMRANHAQICNQTLDLDRANLVKLFIAAIVLLAFLLATGLVGYFPTHWDHQHFRQALFVNLIDAPWPLVLPNGKEMTYYLAGILPQSLLARAVDESLRQWVLLFYIYSVLLVGYMLACFYIKRVSLSLLAMMCLLCDPIGELSYRVIYLAQTMTGIKFSLFESLVSQNSVFWSAPLSASIGAYNSTIYVILVSALFLNLRACKLIALPVIIAMLVPISPAGAMAMMPIALYYFLPELKGRKNIVWGFVGSLSASLIAFCSAVYFLRSDNPTVTTAFSWTILSPSHFSLFYTKQIITALLLLLPLMRFRKKHGLIYVLWCILILPIVHIGSDGTTLHAPLNELWLKGIVIYGFLAFVVWAAEWRNMKIPRYAMLCCVIIASALYMKNQVLLFSPSHPVQDKWDGHLNHNDPFLEQSIPPVKDALIDGVILRQAGESEQYFPSNLFHQIGE